MITRCGKALTAAALIFLYRGDLKMLDLSKIGKDKYYEVRLIDGTELKLNRPTQRMLEFMLTIQDMANDNKDMETIKAFNELFAWILNRNTEGKVYKAEQIADEYDFAIIGLLIKDYFSFWNEDTANIVNFPRNQQQ